MTDPSAGAVPRQLADFDRTEEEDHDLLTFGEAGLRLRETIEKVVAEVSRLRETGADEAVVAARQERLVRLKNAAQRNAAQSINDENFATFFGYEGKARRNTSG